MSKLIKEILLYKDAEIKYSESDKRKIKKELIEKCDAKIKSASRTFLEAIKFIRDL